MSAFDLEASGVSPWTGGATIGDSGASVGTISPDGGVDGFSSVSGATALGGEGSGGLVRPLGSRFSVSSTLG